MAYIYDIADTWNASGTTFTAIKMNVTDTASASGSLLMDLQVGGSSKFNVTKAGAASALSFSVSGASGAIITGGGSNTILFATESVYRAAYRANYFNLASGMSLGFSPDSAFATSAITAPDTILARDAANTLAQRNGVNAQASNLYNTYTDASNYERGYKRWVSNVLQIGTDKLGTGTARALEFQTDGTTRLTISVGGGVVFSGNISAPTTGYIFWSGRSNLDSPANGNIRLTNAAVNDFDRLQFGGTTSSFPALKRSSAALIVRLADDTANAALESASLKTNAPTGGTAATWKLGTVATVTATLPNRTIEVDIGGTIYYLHAKTTND